MQNINEAKKLVCLLGQIVSITGDVVLDGKFDWGDALRVGKLIPVVKDLCTINYSLTAEEFADLTEAEKDEIVVYLNEVFKMDLKLGEEIAEKVFAGILDFYMGIKVAMEVFEKLRVKNFA